MDDIEMNTEDEIVHFENTSQLIKCFIYSFTFFIIMIFGLLLFVIICMIYEYLTVVFM